MPYRKSLIQNEIRSDIYLIESYLDKSESYHLYNTLISLIPWKQYDVFVYGKVYPQPRLCSFVGDDNLKYSYSNLTLVSEKWMKPLKELKRKLVLDFTYNLNSVLANLYRDGNDSNGWHSDDEPELGKNPTLLSLSLGGSRPIHFRSKDHKSKVILNSGDLLIFSGTSQHKSQHMIPKSKTFTDPRINLTFRNIIQ